MKEGKNINSYWIYMEGKEHKIAPFMGGLLGMVQLGLKSEDISIREFVRI